VRSWFLIALAGWLLGVVVATAGSLYAVDQLGRGLLGRPAYGVSLAEVSSQLPGMSSGHRTPPSTTPPSTRSPSPPSGAAMRAAMVPARPLRQRSSIGQVRTINTAGGTAEARCEHGLAYLIYEMPRQGFSARDRRPGPASAASVTFENSTGGLVLRVTCASAGYPVGHVAPVRPAGG
jgi:hypothetical protein